MLQLLFSYHLVLFGKKFFYPYREKSMWVGAYCFIAQFINGFLLNAQKRLKNLALHYEIYHPGYAGFSEAQKSLRVKRTDWAHSKCAIPLPFTIQTDVHEKCNLPRRADRSRLRVVQRR